MVIGKLVMINVVCPRFTIYDLCIIRNDVASTTNNVFFTLIITSVGFGMTFDIDQATMDELLTDDMVRPSMASYEMPLDGEDEKNFEK